LTVLLPSEAEPEEGEPDKYGVWVVLDVAAVELEPRVSKEDLPPPVDLSGRLVRLLIVNQIDIGLALLLDPHDDCQKLEYER
jgi:hypothetical protein